MSTPETTVDRVHAREILDSRGNPTLEVEITLSGGATGRAAVPSGASTGAYEAHELRDGDDRFRGLGVRRAVSSVVERIGPEIVGRDALDQRGLDEALGLLDPTANLAELGANAVLGVSLAGAHAAAAQVGLPLYRFLGGPGASTMPVPFFNVINGGAHADNDVDVQEFMVAPVGAASFAEGLRMGAEVYQALKALLHARGLSTAVGDEGGFAPDLEGTRTALDVLCEAVETASYRLEADVAFALDPASTEFLHDDGYHLDGKVLSADGLVDVWEDLCGAYPIVSIEDGCAEEDWEGWAKLVARLGDRVQLLGDDLLVTNPVRIRRAIDEGCANALLVKPNQIGTLTATLDAIDLVRGAGWRAMMSHRSGETEDVTIAHLAVATGVGQIKSGATARGERTAKFNELLRIEEQLGTGARYPGADALAIRRTGGLGRTE